MLGEGAGEDVIQRGGGVSPLAAERDGRRADDGDEHVEKWLNKLSEDDVRGLGARCHADSKP